jgi:hypothetical protein
MPMVEYVGSSPIRAVEAPISSSVARKDRFRPSRSPSRPNRTAPTGRTTKPVPNAAMLTSRARACSPAGKKNPAKTTARLP